MKDVQNETDIRNISIDKVGIRELHYPLSVLDRSGNTQHTVAHINMYVDLPIHHRGTHMSRFLEVVTRHHIDLHFSNLDLIMKDMLETFECEKAHLEMKFPYFIKKKAPVSGHESMMENHCKIKAEMGGDHKLNLWAGVEVPVHNLCPCSKEISEFGAHNQRGTVRINICAHQMVWFEELIKIAENSSSAPLFSLLKREDEKWVTETAYQNPKFVEDCARDIAVILNKDSRIEKYIIEVENYESIHNHNAFACIQKK